MAIGSWGPVLAMWLWGIEWAGAAGRAIGIWYAVPALVAVLFVQGPWLKQPVLAPLGIRFRVSPWWGVAWMVPVVLLLIGALVSWLAGFEPVLTVDQLIANKRAGVPPDQIAEFDRYVAENPPPAPWMLIVMGLPAGLTLNLIPAMCEEVAFRGYYFREVAGGFWARSTRIGLLWWLWLAPSIAMGNLYGEPGWWGVALALPWCIVASWVLVYLRARSGSVIATGIARGTMLALTRAAGDITFGAPAWLSPFYGVSGIVALSVVWLGFWAHDRRQRTRLTGNGETV